MWNNKVDSDLMEKQLILTTDYTLCKTEFLHNHIHLV
jgi:hypothetical protein